MRSAHKQQASSSKLILGVGIVSSPAAASAVSACATVELAALPAWPLEPQRCASGSDRPALGAAPASSRRASTSEALCASRPACRSSCSSSLAETLAVSYARPRALAQRRHKDSSVSKLARTHILRARQALLCMRGSESALCSSSSRGLVEAVRSRQSSSADCQRFAWYCARSSCVGWVTQ
eukprot:4482942-Pleurochrysis_carterae.AAC.1